MKGGPVREEGRKVGENRRGGGGGAEGGSGRGREPTRAHGLGFGSSNFLKPGPLIGQWA